MQARATIDRLSFDTLSIRQVESLLDYLPDAPFFVKDEALRYVAANDAMLRLCGLAEKGAIIGKCAGDLFPEATTAHFEELDRSVLRTGRPIRDQLEQVEGLRGPATWLLFSRWPVLERGKVIGVAAIARILEGSDRRNPSFDRVSRAVKRMQARFGEPFNIGALAREFDISVTQLERDFVNVFGISPRRYLIKARFEAALELLEGDQSIAEIAHACGYKDQSAFTRQFHATSGMSPSAYRRLHRS
jgi:AraC-like DNA-binding protein